VHIGLLTARFGEGWDFERVARWASRAGFAALEVHTHHLDPQETLADDGASVKKLLNETGLRISSLAHYGGFSADHIAGEDYRQMMRDTIRAAEVLGVDVVCTLAGFPAAGKSKEQTIRDILPDTFGPLAEDASGRGVRIAFENWFATNLQHLDHFRTLFEVVPNDNLGLNFDPSHLYWQQIDYLAAVEEFKDRIFHVHAKDAVIYPRRRARVGVLDGGWWRYVIPGFGEIPWGRFLLALREAGYDGVLSVEHEDGAFSAEEGFAKALQHLRQFV
jgi:sugar phosphate isomerase/epimerase